MSIKKVQNHCRIVSCCHAVRCLYSVAEAIRCYELGPHVRRHTVANVFFSAHAAVNSVCLGCPNGRPCAPPHSRQYGFQRARCCDIGPSWSPKQIATFAAAQRPMCFSAHAHCCELGPSQSPKQTTMYTDTQPLMCVFQRRHCREPCAGDNLALRHGSRGALPLRCDLLQDLDKIKTAMRVATLPPMCLSAHTLL